jgi:hypothetical protein
MADGRAFDVVIRQAVHPITSEVLVAAFRAAGETEQVTVNSPEQSPSGETSVTAFVVFRDAAAGQNAMRMLQGRAIYPNACFVELRPSAAGAGLAAAGGAPYGGGYGHHYQHHYQHHQHHHVHHQHHHYGAMRGGVGGFMPRGRGFGAPAMMGAGGPMMGAAPMMMGAGAVNPGMMGMGGAARGGYGAVGYGRGGMPDPMAMAAYGQQYGGAPGMMGVEPAVLMVNGVPTGVSLMKLFILLEVYGVVLGLRRQLKQPEVVIAKFEQFHDAILCAKLLTGAPFYGSELGLRHFAGFTDRQGFMPAAGACADPDDPACQSYDFTTTRHRGRPHGHGGVTGRKYSPCPNLFVGNLLESITDQEARDIFAGRGFEVVDFERKSPAHALCQLRDTQAAIEAVIATNSVVVKDRFVKVTFSGFAPHSAPGGGGGGGGGGMMAPPAAAMPSAYDGGQHQQQQQHAMMMMDPLQQQQMGGDFGGEPM